MKRTKVDTTMLLLALSDKCLAEQIEWHKLNNPNLTEKQLEAFEAGFSQGWQRCAGMIRLHKINLNI